MTYLAIDVGSQHLGLALADGPLARPLPSQRHHSLSASAANILELAKDHQAKTIIIGLPQGEIARLARALAARLTKLSPLPIVLHDESLTTHEALHKLREGGAKRRKLKNEHSYAACLILEDYLESTPK